MIKSWAVTICQYRTVPYQGKIQYCTIGSTRNLPKNADNLRTGEGLESGSFLPWVVLAWVDSAWFVSADFLGVGRFGPFSE